jgi:hypothetical protein
LFPAYSLFLQSILQDANAKSKHPAALTPAASLGHESRVGFHPSPKSSEELRTPREHFMNLETRNSSLPLPNRNSLHLPDSQSSTLSHGHLTASETGPSVDASFNRDSVGDDSGEDIQSMQTLREVLCNARIEWPQGSFRYFIAVDNFNNIVTQKSISVELERCGTRFPNDQVRDQTVEKIRKSAPKLFAILVCLQRGKFITEFLDEGIDDSDLPFVRSDNTDKSGHFKLCSGKLPEHPIKCMTSWNQTHVNDFGRDQWCMLPHIFEYHDDIEHYELDDNCVLPWVEDEELSDRAIEGGFGSVWKIAIHPAHQRILTTARPKVQ